MNAGMEEGMDAGTAPLLDALHRSQRSERHSFHMPGHKGVGGVLDAAFGPSVAAADVSEMDGSFPYLHAPSGAIQQAQELAALRWGADATFFLVNGTTVGNIAAVRIAPCTRHSHSVEQRPATCYPHTTMAWVAHSLCRPMTRQLCLAAIPTYGRSTSPGRTTTACVQI
jgi:hypothetical protein